MLLPIEQWRNGDLLKDPFTGGAYDPNLPPSLIASDDVLRSAIIFGQENARRIGVTVLCGMQQEAADLGEPGEFEAHMRRTDIYGSSSFGFSPEPGTEGYNDRVMQAVHDVAFSHQGRFLQPFNTMDWRNMEATDVLRALRSLEEAVTSRAPDFDMMVSLDMASLGMETVAEDRAADFVAGEIHLSNHLNWLVVANACDQAMQFDQIPGRDNDRIRVLIDESPTGLDIVRKFGAIGIKAESHRLRTAAWPVEALGQVLDFASIMATGRLSAAV